jgi:hypothetical protein
LAENKWVVSAASPLTLMIAALTPKHESRAMGDDVNVEEGRREVE